MGQFLWPCSLCLFHDCVPILPGHVCLVSHYEARLHTISLPIRDQTTQVVFATLETKLLIMTGKCALSKQTWARSFGIACTRSFASFPIEPMKIKCVCTSCRFCSNCETSSASIRYLFKFASDMNKMSSFDFAHVSAESMASNFLSPG